MPEPLLAIGLFAGYSAFYGATRAGSAVSSEAKSVQRSVIAIVETVERSQVLFGDKSEAISAIRALVAECKDVGWDGEAAEPINRVAASLAEDFVRALPHGVPLPEFTPEPDGAISLDWIKSRNRLISVSVGPNNRLAFAWLDGTDRGHAVARFYGQTVPERILEGIHAIIGHGTTSLRAA